MRTARESVAMALVAALVASGGMGCNDDADGTSVGDGTETGHDDEHGGGETFSSVSVTASTSVGTVSTTETTTCVDGTCTDVTTDPTMTTIEPETESDTDTPIPGWPDPGVFGDDVQEQDLVGTWTMPWEPSDHWDSSLYVYEDGFFEWIEWSADCSALSYAAGTLWVEGTQIVMHVETWERPLPWATETVIGESFPPPFRLRLGYTVLGEYLAFSAPPAVTATGPYPGRSYVQIEDGDALSGLWVAEAELHAIPPGELAPVVVVRDRYEAHLDAPFPDTAEGTGVRARVQIYYWPDPPVMTPAIYEGGNWQDLDPGQSAGSALVNGSEIHAYGPSYGVTQLMSWTAETSFRLGVASDCEG